MLPMIGTQTTIGREITSHVKQPLKAAEIRPILSWQSLRSNTRRVQGLAGQASKGRTSTL